MSSRKPQQTPLTPYGRRALEQRSAAKTRSARSRRTLGTIAQPLSVGGILRRLAKATAKESKKSEFTPRLEEKENGEDDETEEEAEEYLSPRLLEEEGEDDDSELPTAPTPSILPEDAGGDPTMTFKSIDFARDGDARPASERPRRRSDRVSFAATVLEDDDDDDTLLTAEMGMRAMSEGPMDRFPRNSFGSIRMSDFAEQRRESGRTDGASFMDDYYLPVGNDDDNDMDLTQGAETQDLRQLQRSPSHLSENELSLQVGTAQDDEDTFRLQLPSVGQETQMRPTLLLNSPEPQPQNDQDSDFEDINSASDNDAEGDGIVLQSPSHTRKQTPLEAIASRPRKRKLKLTRHGTTVPSLPTSLIKRIAIDSRTRIGKRKPVLGRDHVKALEQAAEWFFEQVGDDLNAFSNHAGRKKRVDGSDVLALMRRQRLLRGQGELANLAKEWLPRKVLEELDLPEQL